MSSAPFLFAAEVAAGAGIRDPLRWRSSTCLHFRHVGHPSKNLAVAHGHSHASLMPARLAHLQALAIPAKEASWDLL